MIDISKDYIIGFIEGRCSFTLNKSGNAYLFKFQINMKKSENNLTFLEELKHNLGDIGKIQIVNKKSLSYAIRKHEEIKIIIKYLGDDPFYNGKMDLYKIWKESFEYYVTHTFGKGKISIGLYRKVKCNVIKKMNEYNNEVNKFKFHRIKNKKVIK